MLFAKKTAKPPKNAGASRALFCAKLDALISDYQRDLHARDIADALESRAASLLAAWANTSPII
jgi:hypothetical protein